mgnify:CR=1 FL=1
MKKTYKIEVDCANCANLMNPNFLASLPPGGMCPQYFRYASYVKSGSV